LRLDILSYIYPLFPTLTKSLFILLIGFVAVKVAKKVVKTAVRKFDDGDDATVSEKEQRAQTLGDILNGATGITIWGVTIITLLSEWGINITPIITGAGIIGLGVGFGAQTLVKDVISGFFLLLENQYNKGDSIELLKIKGKVQNVSLRTTTLKDDKGNIHIIPNSQIKSVTKFKK